MSEATELRGLLGFARGLGLDEASVREIYETIGREAEAAGASDDDRIAVVRPLTSFQNACQHLTMGLRQNGLQQLLRRLTRRGI